jgi:hypothetical protein
MKHLSVAFEDGGEFVVLENRNKQTEEGVHIPLYSIKPALVRLHDLYSPYSLEQVSRDICTPSPGDDRILVVEDYKRSERT